MGSSSFFDLTPSLTPEGYAVSLLHDLKINSFPVRLHDVITALKIFYREDDMGQSGSYDGFLAKIPGKTGILINKNIEYEPRKRFTIAHEIGHLTIKGHIKKTYKCTPLEIERYHSKSKEEYEANRFASEFLLPSVEVKKKLKMNEASMSLIKKISEEFGTSLSATALKVVKLAENDSCMVLLSENGTIAWSCSSPGISKSYNARTGRLSADTYAHDYFKGLSVPDGPQRVGPAGWLVGNIRGLYEVIEESIYFNRLGTVLTLITIPQRNCEEGFDEEELM